MSYADISSHAAWPELSRRQWAGLLWIAAAGAAGSLLITGYLFGVDNNAFHLPMVGSLFDEPQLKSDTFIQSLRYFASGVWLLLRGSGRYVDPAWLFLALLYFSRWLSFVGLLLCGSLLGVRGTRQNLVCGAFLCFTVLLQGEAAAGDGGLFINYFAQSEIANGTILIALYHAVRARLDRTLIFLGATAFVNVFMAVWLGAPLIALAVFHLRSGRLESRGLLKQAWVGGAVLLAFVLPILYNIVSNPDFGQRPSFDYAAFVEFLYPYHFLPRYILLREYRELAVVVLLAGIALLQLGAAARPFLYVLAGMLASYLFGIIAALVTPSQAVLNLELMRSGVLLYLLAALACGSLVTIWLHSSDRLPSRVFGPLLGATLCVSKSLLPWGVVVMVIRWVWTARGWKAALVPRLDWVLLAVLACGVWPYSILHNWRDNSADAVYVAEMTALGDWASRHTPADAIFLMPTEWYRKHAGKHPAVYTLEEREIINGQGAFVYHARRRLRGSFTEGSAVMWSPSYYHEWRSDIDAALGLRSVPEKIDYARKEGIGYVLVSCQEPDADRYTPVFRTPHACVFSAL